MISPTLITITVLTLLSITLGILYIRSRTQLNYFKMREALQEQLIKSLETTVSHLTDQINVFKRMDATNKQLHDIQKEYITTLDAGLVSYKATIDNLSKQITDVIQANEKYAHTQKEHLDLIDKLKSRETDLLKQIESLEIQLSLATATEKASTTETVPLQAAPPEQPITEAPKTAPQATAPKTASPTAVPQDNSPKKPYQPFIPPNHPLLNVPMDDNASFDHFYIIQSSNTGVAFTKCPITKKQDGPKELTPNNTWATSIKYTISINPNYSMDVILKEQQTISELTTVYAGQPVITAATLDLKTAQQQYIWECERYSESRIQSTLYNKL